MVKESCSDAMSVCVICTCECEGKRKMRAIFLCLAHTLEHIQYSKPALKPVGVHIHMQRICDGSGGSLVFRSAVGSVSLAVFLTAWPFVIYSSNHTVLNTGFITHILYSDTWNEHTHNTHTHTHWNAYKQYEVWSVQKELGRQRVMGYSLTWQNRSCVCVYV